MVCVGANNAFCSEVESPNPWTLSWEAPASCPAPADVEGEIRRLLRTTKSNPNREPLEASARITQDPGGFELELTTQEHGHYRVRRLGAPDCAELATASALIVALAIDPDLSNPPQAAAPPPADRLPEPIPQPEPVQPSPAPRHQIVPWPEEPRRATAREIPLTWRLGAGAVVGHGILPHTAFGPSLSALLYWDFLRLQIGFSRLSTTFDVPDSDYQAWFVLSRATAQVCWSLYRQSVLVGPCLGNELGQLRGTGKLIAISHTQRSFWVASSLGVFAQAQLGGGVDGALLGELLHPWRRDQFELAQEPIPRAGSWAGQVSVHLVVGNP